MSDYRTPGIYREDVFLQPAAELRTGVPAFLGYAERVEPGGPDVERLTLAKQFTERFRPTPGGYLGYALRGFFANGGSLCFVAPLQPGGDAGTDLARGLQTLEGMDTIDLVCAPDIMRPRASPANASAIAGPDSFAAEVTAMQAAVLEHCDRLGNRFAILDALPCASVEEVLAQRAALRGNNGALYYPWIRLADGPVYTGPLPLKASRLPALKHGFVPPCGHLAGVYARTDARVGVHKPPANDVIEEALDLDAPVGATEQGALNPAGVNCLRAFPGRGIRPWGARTLSPAGDWTYISVRRLFLTAGRWIERNLAGTVFEPNDPGLWARIERELTAYFADLFRRGALMGRSPGEAFYVKCDAGLNPPAEQEAGRVNVEIGLAPTIPNEFVILRIIHSASGMTIAGPTRPGF